MIRLSAAKKIIYSNSCWLRHCLILSNTSQFSSKQIFYTFFKNKIIPFCVFRVRILAFIFDLVKVSMTCSYLLLFVETMPFLLHIQDVLS